MEDVTDAAFRRLIARYGKPHVFFTEFTSADGLVLAPEEGQKVLRSKLMFDEGERPIVAQLFSSIPERMEAAARIASNLGFDGIDINMGCPDRAVEKGGAGAALIKNSKRARELIRAAQKGGGGIPVSVKTRMGYNEDEMETWLPEILAEKPANLTLHLRTRKEMSLVPAHWGAMRRATLIRDRVSPGTFVTGNGDVVDLDEAHAKVRETGCDGVMLGRAIYGNPWLYANQSEPPSPRERIEALAEHIRLFEELLGNVSNFATMKKHFKAYISGWDGAKELRTQLMDVRNASEAIAILHNASIVRLV